MTEFDSSEHEIEQKLDSLRGTPSRDPELIKSGRDAFLRQASMLRAEVPADLTVTKPSNTRHKGWNTIFQRKETRKMSVLPTLIIIATLFFGGTGATVAAAQSAQPDDLLYPVKLVTEELVVEFSGSPEKKVKNEMNRLERRSEELDLELDEDGEVEDEVTDSLIDQLDETIDSTENLDRENQMEALLRIQAHMEQVLQDKIDRGNPVVAQQNIQNLLNKIQARITILQQYMDAPEDQKPKINFGHWKDALDDGTEEPPVMDGTPTVVPTDVEGLNQNQNNGKGNNGNNGKNKQKTPKPDNND
jgi:hypothetical protein